MKEGNTFSMGFFFLRSGEFVLAGAGGVLFCFLPLVLLSYILRVYFVFVHYLLWVILALFILICESGRGLHVFGM